MTKYVKKYVPNHILNAVSSKSSLLQLFYTIFVLENLTQCRTTRSPWGLQLYYKETSTQLFSCKYCDIFKSTFFTEHLQWLLLAMHRKIPLMESLLLLACVISKKQNFFRWAFLLPLHDCFQLPSVLHISETYFGPCQRSMMELFSKIGND